MGYWRQIQLHVRLGDAVLSDEPRAGNRPALEHSDQAAFGRQIRRSSQPAGSRADDGGAVLGGEAQVERLLRPVGLRGEIAFQCADIDRLVHIRPAASRQAGRVA